MDPIIFITHNFTWNCAEVTASLIPNGLLKPCNLSAYVAALWAWGETTEPHSGGSLICHQKYTQESAQLQQIAMLNLGMFDSPKWQRVKLSHAF